MLNNKVPFTKAGHNPATRGLRGFTPRLCLCGGLFGIRFGFGKAVG